MPTNRKQFSKIKSKAEQEISIVANRYQVLKKLGSGSYGTVFLINDLKTDKSKKVLKKIHIGDLEPDETISAVNEARLLSKLDHPGIVKFHDSFIDREFFCLITEFCEGGDLDVKLHSWKKNDKSVDKSLVLTWFVQLVLAVQYMHQRRVLHRDLKTRNIFVKSNMVKIGDFGISRILQGSTDIATTFTGTPYFMAPEILKHEGYNSKSDIWSLGIILYEMCTLKKAFQGSNLMGVMFNIVEGDVPKLPLNFNKELHVIYESMLCKTPSERISATEILKKPYIVRHLQKLRIKMSGNRTIDRKLANQEALEIAQALSAEKISKSKNTQYLTGRMTASHLRPLTPKEQMKIRKQQRADEELERLKKVTVKTYNESRRRCTDFKQRQEHSSTDGVELDSNMNKQNLNFNLNVVEATAEEDVDVFELPSSDNVFECDDNKVERARVYTNCFGDEEEETLAQARKYTHCFGDDSSAEENEDEDTVFEETNKSNDLTNVSAIPEDADLADTYYSTYDDFEDDDEDNDDVGDESGVSSDSSLDDGVLTDDYGELVGCMENALDLAENHVESTLVEQSPPADGGGGSIRKEKIEKLKGECIRLLGEDGFHKVYHFLNEVRFNSKKTISEDAIMKRLRKLVGSSRDCFLVDQLLFLEKQNQIFDETF